MGAAIKLGLKAAALEALVGLALIAAFIIFMWYTMEKEKWERAQRKKHEDERLLAEQRQKEEADRKWKEEGGYLGYVMKRILK